MTRSAFEETVAFSQADFDLFARLSGDDNPIHTDPAFAARTVFGSTVAHGMMLFGVVSAATGRRLGPVSLHAQRLMFPAPTLAGRDYRIRLDIRDAGAGTVRIGQTVIAPDGSETLVGEAVAGDRPRSLPAALPAAPPTDADAYKGMHIGMSAERTRTFTPEEVAAFCALVDERDPRYRTGGEVPPALVGGTVSELLGVDLPGPGSNWLKQDFELGRPVRAGDVLSTTVAVARFRPAKHLVNLSSSCTVAGTPVMEGYSLVHTQDVRA